VDPLLLLVFCTASPTPPNRAVARCRASRRKTRTRRCRMTAPGLEELFQRGGHVPALLRGFGQIETRRGPLSQSLWSPRRNDGGRGEKRPAACGKSSPRRNRAITAFNEFGGGRIHQNAQLHLHDDCLERERRRLMGERSGADRRLRKGGSSERGHTRASNERAARGRRLRCVTVRRR